MSVGRARVQASPSLLVAICASVAGCGLADRPDALPETARLEEVLDGGREIRLEENDEVLNVAPVELPPNAVVRSFGRSPFSQTRNETAPHLASLGEVSIRGETLALIFALNDTLYCFTTDGRRIGARPIRSRHFRRVPPETPQAAASGSDQGKWLATFDHVDDVHWPANGDLIVTYVSLDAVQSVERPPERRWRLLHLRRDGTWDLEIGDTPRVLAVDRDGEELYFVAPGAEAPNRWFAARFRGSSGARRSRGHIPRATNRARWRDNAPRRRLTPFESAGDG